MHIHVVFMYVCEWVYNAYVLVYIYMHACSFNKHLQSVDDLMCVFFRPCTCLDWDKDGDILAITQENNGDFNLLHTHSLLYSETSL